MHRFVLTAACAAVLALGAAATPSRADVLLIERVRLTQDIAMPQRGLSMAQVEQRFGAPAEKLAPVGGGHPQRPPIARWVYPAFTVYFEKDLVIDAVANHGLPGETGPKPVPPRTR